MNSFDLPSSHRVEKMLHPNSSPTVAAEFESVYLVLRPINFNKSSIGILQRFGEWTDKAKLHQYLLFQHWGVQIGEHFYHLHIVDEEKEDGSGKRQKLAVSLSPFEHVTLKIPIWMTKKRHEDRVKDAISLIRAMGGYKSDDEVGVYGDYSGEKELLLPESERARYRNTQTFKHFFPMPFRGEYHVTLNNCIHFARRYLFYFIYDVVPFTSIAAEYSKKMEWVVKKWVTSLCNLDYAKVLDMFMGLMNPMRRMTLKDGNALMAHLAMVFVGKMKPEEITKGGGASLSTKAITDGPENTDEPLEKEGADTDIDDIEEDGDQNGMTERSEGD
ncbi:hypothetical protein BDQ17DRAFT_1545788 [Cyathus striatus]|nr:hypothetical protein BDQ17DRAFT_1545788 [Cyathus striatus]